MEERIPAEESVTQIRQQPQAAPTPRPTPPVSRDRVHESPAPTSSNPLSQGRFPNRRLVGSNADVQHGIMVMAILGPCRAFDPPALGSTRNGLLPSGDGHLIDKR